MPSNYTPQMVQSPSTLLPPRDSLELASLASSDHDGNGRTSFSSSSAGVSSSRKLSLEDAETANGPAGLPLADRRSYSVSSAFDFNSALFPLSASGAGYTALGTPSTPNFDLGGQQSLEKNKSLTFLNGLSLRNFSSEQAQ
ncbi:hypothetical protein B0A55_06067 [Friedmanniomyces simplex]|uniref:Uncharacterized protein n=1 Tax=Friedmanniomyces simplex TaxID=329884 RepID=A0A4U0XCQ3_9PEZI|nr:hypothetical protein B0A55_06067 [Friedmanniomyces simplex]